MSKKIVEYDKNDNLSHLRGIDLQELIVQIDDFEFDYRDSLNLPPYVSYGIEIEYENVFKSSVDRYINKFENWISKYDGSLSFGGEIESPILYDYQSTWQEIQEICTFLKKKRANTCNNAGGHIHVGSHILGNNLENWKKFIKLYTSYESVLFRFSYGDKISARKTALEFAPPIADILYKKIKYINDVRNIYRLHDILPPRKEQAMNLCNVKCSSICSLNDKNTIEFRIPNATVEEKVWQNNINTFTKMMLAPSREFFDQEFIDYKLKYEYISSKQTYMYNEVCLKNALEFCDLIFDNNLDKLYFLKQYIKGFENNYGVKGAIKSKKFIRNI